MKSRIAAELRLATQPVALLWSDDCPPEAARFRPGRWGCVMMHIAQSATRGRVAAFDRETYGCWGGGVGLGFGNCYGAFPGGEASFHRFLSSGNRGDASGEAVAEQVRPFVTGEFHDDLLDGERYFASPEVVRAFVEALPLTDIPARYALFKPLDLVREEEAPVNVTFFVDPARLSALVVLANHGTPAGDRVTIPYAAACQQLGILAYRAGASRPQRAVVGMTDLSARKNTRGLLGEDVLSFTVPYEMFGEMEMAAASCFLQRPVWTRLVPERGEH